MAIRVYTLYNNSRVILALLMALMLGIIILASVWLSLSIHFYC